MKTGYRNPTAGVMLCFALILALPLTGCNDRRDASMADGSVAAGETNSAAMDVDNTRNNLRDRSSATLTPLDQGKSPADLAITQNLRKLIVNSTNNYSLTAKNIKIITVDGRITLRGPVATQAEKSGIVSLAKAAVGESNVDDQLEVKSNP